MKTRKRILSLLMVLIMVLSMVPMTAVTAWAEGLTTVSATSDSANVYVTIADETGKLVMIQQSVTVTDKDKDGKLTIDEALYAAHEAKYPGGAAAGYGSYTGEYGLSMSKLWGNESGSYGYYVNNASAWSLADEVQEGDYVNAFVYTDLVAWSDTFCYFDQHTAAAESGKALELTLSAAGYDASYNPVTVPVEGATITVNGETTTFKTDAEGKVSVVLDAAGTYTLSATSATQTLVPPVCVVTVTTPVVEAPELDGFTTSYASWGEQTFKSDTYTYDLTIAQSRTYESIKATFDATKYTASYSYNNGAETGNLTSDKPVILYIR